MKNPGFEGPAFNALVLAVSLCGTQTELARRLGKPPGFVWNWLRRDGMVPIDYVPRVVQVVADSRITPFSLRPDYPYWGLLAVELVCTQMDVKMDVKRVPALPPGDRALPDHANWFVQTVAGEV